MSVAASKPIKQARKEFCKILVEVETKGRRVTVTNHGKPVARIVPMADGGRDEDIQKWIEELRAARKTALKS